MAKGKAKHVLFDGDPVADEAELLDRLRLRKERAPSVPVRITFQGVDASGMLFDVSLLDDAHIQGLAKKLIDLL